MEVEETSLIKSLDTPSAPVVLDYGVTPKPITFVEVCSQLFWHAYAFGFSGLGTLVMTALVSSLLGSTDRVPETGRLALPYWLYLAAVFSASPLIPLAFTKWAIESRWSKRALCLWAFAMPLVFYFSGHLDGVWSDGM